MGYMDLETAGTIRVLINGGASPTLHNNHGKTAIHNLVAQLESWNKNGMPPITILHTLRVLLLSCKLSVDGPLGNCNCDCFELGCWLPSDEIGLELNCLPGLPFLNTLWLLEYLSMLEDNDRPDLARRSILSMLRRAKFAALELQHDSHCPANELKEEEERPWEIIEREKMLETLESHMETLRLMSLVELKREAMIELGRSYKLAAEAVQAKKDECERERETLTRKRARFPETSQHAENAFADDPFDIMDLMDGNWFSLPEVDPSLQVDEYVRYLKMDKRWLGEVHGQDLLGGVDETRWRRPRLEWLSEFKRATGLED
ncbi:hypothetical protein B0T16DRAFT_455179 [Cercophora newfieldiana]|uniref:Uncharacterized protein n=1 Tax=Cercophora newfieldiana TaxID=92897 RepID=A0AA39YHS6_9PEZI|nr:hypothetical protein B0T16DRAFT_455179 [Cercophora newfieldiana]